MTRTGARAGMDKILRHLRDGPEGAEEKHATMVTVETWHRKRVHHHVEVKKGRGENHCHSDSIKGAQRKSTPPR
jgi:hypothetical protein